MGACVGCSQLILVIINLLFSLVGLALLVVGCLVRFGSDVFDSYLSKGYNEFQQVINDAADTQGVDIGDLDVGAIVGDSTIAFIVIGAFFFLLGIFGCIGAVCKVKMLLTVYAIVLLVIFVAELVFVILLFTMKSKIDGWIKDPLIETLEEKYSGANGTNIFTVTVNFLMHELKCCGIENYTEFANAPHWGYNNKTKIIPYICCTNTTDNTSRRECAESPNANNSYIEQGCYKAVNDWITDQANILIGAGSGVAAVQLILIVFSFIICCESRRGDKDDDTDGDEFPIEPYRESKDMHAHNNMAYSPDRGFPQDGGYPQGGGYPGPGYQQPVPYSGGGGGGYPGQRYQDQAPYQGRHDRYNGPPEGYGPQGRRR